MRISDWSSDVCSSDLAEFVDPESFRAHYTTTAERITQRLVAAAERGEVRAGVGDIHAWAIMGMNVFLGLRFGVWADDRSAVAVAATIAYLLANGLAVRCGVVREIAEVRFLARNRPLYTPANPRNRLAGCARWGGGGATAKAGHT